MPSPFMTWGIAIISAAILTCLAIRDRRAGWVKDRRSQNVLLDTGLLWAQVHYGHHESSSGLRASALPVEAEPAGATLAGQLSNLNVAVRANAGAVPEPVAAPESNVEPGVTAHRR